MDWLSTVWSVAKPLVAAAIPIILGRWAYSDRSMKRTEVYSRITDDILDAILLDRPSFSWAVDDILWLKKIVVDSILAHPKLTNNAAIADRLAAAAISRRRPR